MVIYDRLEDVPREVMLAGGNIQIRELPAEFQGTIGRGIAISEDGSGAGDGPRLAWIVPVWLIELLPFIIKGTICIIGIYAVSQLVHTIRVIPQAKKLEESANGNSLWQAPDGSTFIFDKDGNYLPGSEPPADWTEQIKQIAVVVVVLVVVIALIVYGPKLLGAAKAFKAKAPARTEKIV